MLPSQLKENQKTTPYERAGVTAWFQRSYDMMTFNFGKTGDDQDFTTIIITDEQADNLHGQLTTQTITGG